MTADLESPESKLTARLREAAATAFGPEFAEVDALVRRSDRADYQANLAMGLGKQLKRPPRAVAEALVAALKWDDFCERVEIAGPGFLNITLAPSYLEGLLARSFADPRCGVALAARPQTVVIDYASPNVAKEMHVGHLRSSIIGDSIARVLERLGHRVIRQNHIGDWGTPFGMLIEHLIDVDDSAGAAERSMGELNEFYRAARVKFDGDPAFADRARQRVVLLQAGDPDTLALWRKLVDASTAHFGKVFERLGIQLTPADIRGESFYNPMLPEIARDLESRGLAVENDGALCVFVESFRSREGDPLPLIVRKNDGGFGYAATDLAAIRFRATELGGNRLVYVVGAPQQQHLAMVFEVARRAGYVGPEVTTEHVAFGSILGPDRKMFKTRSGETVRLIDLLQEGEEKAAAAMSQELTPEARSELARAISLGAIKYADLSSDRVKDYVFDWTRMLAFEGNTGPYLQYAHARIRSIFRKLEGAETAEGSAIRIEHPHERALGLTLLGFDAAVRSVAHGLEPHKLCGYLYELATTFTAFYEACPVLKAESSSQRASRLALSELTARVLQQGLSLLGIQAPERM